MDYNYESLLDERFQMLCQALLLLEYPGVQCYPVGMPDGGRDATAPDAGGRVVFQVKYARNPHGIKNPLKWVIDAIDGEVHKVKKLASRGASSFVLMTNMPGTSHLDVGRMDKVQAHLDKVMPIPSSCWWRDDLDRRLDGSYNLKLTYPSLLSGTDMIRVLWEATGSGQDQKRRSNALTAYFADQSERDSKVRFKQADLSPSPLFDLFIDVPAVPRIGREKIAKARLDHYQRAVASALRSRHPEDDSIILEEPYYVDSSELVEMRSGSGVMARHSVGAASLILSHSFGQSASRIVLEGAPGQGKSTFAQYISQVQRCRILRSDSVASLPLQDAASPLMMPFKMELRDLATWLKGIDPWAPGESTEHGRNRSLESALAAHVERYSGGVPFDVSDLLFVIEGAATLVILDALDEVADLDDRQRVVDEVTAAATRLEARCPDLKLVITSRPTAVAGSPTFDDSKFYYLTLAAIRPNLAMRYTEKWAKARNLEPSDLDMLLSVLRQKLQAPHMAELAKNTMQLSILLSLTHLRGSTLPDKRTELYDAYIDVFLNREAEKDRTVRENRELLVNIHRYLGYYLHARAEVDGATGRLSTEELRGVLTAFLQRETASSPSMQRRVADLIDSLLTGVVERVVALVSRVEGTYEFEVQPLREYFAAKYLYETAPYAPATRNQSGTKPDRFDGIAPNPYWMNVTRFFAGCFSKGELLDLADRTARLIEDSHPMDAAYPRTLALCLLQDWVFTQSAASMKRILETVFDKAGIRWAASKELSSRSAGYGADVSVEFSPSAGYEILIDCLWPVLNSDIPLESREAVCAILRRQPDNPLLVDLWLKEVAGKGPQELVDWCAIGNSLGVFRAIGFERFENVLEKMDAPSVDFGMAAYVQGGGSWEELSPDERHRVTRAILNGTGAGRLAVQFAANGSAILRVCDVMYYAHLMRRPEYLSPEYLPHIVSDMFGGKSPDAYKEARYQPLLRHVFALKDSPTIDFDFWRGLFVEMRRAFGKTFRECSLANLAVSTKDPTERGAGSRSLFDDNRPLVDRLRNARRRARQVDWWEAQYEQAEDSIDRGMWILAAFSWVHPEALVHLIGTFNRAIQELEDEDYLTVLRACRNSRSYAKYSRSSVSLDEAALVDLSWRSSALLLSRLSSSNRALMLARFLGSRTRDRLAGSVFMDQLVREIITGNFDLTNSIRSICAAVRRGIASDPVDYGFHDVRLPDTRETRALVIKNSWELPASLVSVAHSVPDTRRRFHPVMEIAEVGNWFDE
ncbi:hypothetical protein DWB77_04986 [Streptomyces hundungensis]|uniref:NACHT domain-containing protein n=1 Tax=Streptomyces hundungensis TaxID=1077946 RepID=A0A387HH39_9ACTN|nr:NACHT domain-containing protein [Streptomyces hundungensis]AYG82799.1 hypothetical protein DWB77_04986 [Streptomyces hundungensis]